MPNEPRLFILAGGGTGGHIYPNVAIAERLAALVPDARFRFLVSDRPVDAEVLGGQLIAGRAVDFVQLPARPFGTHPRPLVALARSWSPAVRLARDAIHAFALQHDAAPEDVRVIATGGFVTPPAFRAAGRDECVRTLVNLDAAPGLANRVAARFADEVLTAAPVPGREEWTQVAPIYRLEAIDPRDPREARQDLGLDPERATLLVTGASQGARSINAFMRHLLQEAPGLLEGWQVIHQTGAHRPGDPPDLSPESLASLYEARGVPALVEAFFRRMGSCWRAASLAVSRAGAGSVAEAHASNVRTLFFPYPYHKDQHQRLNAQPLVEQGQALVLDDLVEPASNLNRHRDLLARELATAPRLGWNLESLRPSGAEAIARRILRVP